MDILEKLLQPAVIGPLIGLIAVIGGVGIGAAKLYFNHQERIEKIKVAMTQIKSNSKPPEYIYHEIKFEWLMPHQYCCRLCGFIIGP